MRAYEIQGAFGLENLKLVERAEPEVGPGQVRVKVSVASLNYRDLLMVQGHYDARQPLPLVPLSDGVGIIDAVGEGVTHWSVGQRVAGLFCQGWYAGEPDQLRATLGGPLGGMLAEKVVLDDDGVIEVPQYLSDAEAATLPCAALTAWSALVTYGGIGAGDTVLIQGTGGVSSFALDFARMHGARVIATTSSAQKHDFLRNRGVSDVINYVDNLQWGKAVRERTDGRGVDHVVEVGGAGTLSQSMRAVRPGGTISLIGVLAGGAGKMNLTALLMNNIKVQGVFVGHRDGFVAMNRALEHHQLHPVVDCVFPFDEAVDAFEHLAAGRHRGKVCIAIGADAALDA